MRVRGAVPGDLEAVVRLERGALEAPHWAEGEYGAALAGDGGVSRRVFVGEFEGSVVGFAVGMVVAGEGEIENVVVAGKARRAGMGRALCGAVMAWCGEQGATEVRLEVRVGSAGARALYAGLGFVAVGRRPRYYRHPVEDAVVMRLERAVGERWPGGAEKGK